MKTYKEFLIEKRLVTRAESKKFVEFGGIESYLSPHSQQRMRERDVNPEGIKELVLDALKYTKAKPAEVGKTFEVMFWSKGKKQAIIASHRRDEPSIKKKYFFVVTILDQGRDFAQEGTKKIVIENMLCEFEGHIIELD